MAVLIYMGMELELLYLYSSYSLTKFTALFVAAPSLLCSFRTKFICM